MEKDKEKYIVREPNGWTYNGVLYCFGSQIEIPSEEAKTYIAQGVKLEKK